VDFSESVSRKKGIDARDKMAICAIMRACMYVCTIYLSH
jgi:hypothetical protein